MKTLDSIKATSLEPIEEAKMVDLLGGFSDNSVSQLLADGDLKKKKIEDQTKSNKCDKCDKCSICW